jgi:hypothetical protein
MTGNKITTIAAVLGTLALHALGVALLVRDDPPRHSATAPASLQVRLVQGAPANAASAAPAVAPGIPQPYFFLPDELDRPLIVLRDRSGDADITLDLPVIMHLLVDAQGRVVRMEFEGEAPPVLLQAQLRLAFSTMEFQPALKGGRAVPARFKIELLQQPVGK